MALLVAIDVIILLVYDIVEGVRDKLEASLVPHKENPEDVTGVGLREDEGRDGGIINLAIHF